MEKYLDKLSELLEHGIKEVEQLNLDYYFDNVNEHIFFDILNKNDSWNKVFHNIDEHYQSNKFLATHDPSICNNISKLIAAILNTKNKPKKVLLLPLIVHLDNRLLLTQYLINQGFFTSILDNIFSLLEKFSLSTNIPVLDLHWEAESFRKYQTGIKYKNIADIYNFVSAFERGRNFIPNSFINICVFILSQLSPRKAVELVENQDDTLSVIQLIANLPTKNKLQLANASKNQLLKFEVVREVVYFQKTSVPLCKVEHELILNIILSFSKDTKFWAQFLEFYLEYPLRSPLLFLPLGNVLSQLNEKNLDAFVSAIRISEYNSLDCKQALNACFNNIQDEKTKISIAKKVLSKWELFIEEYHGYLNRLLTTNVIDIIIYHTTNNLNKKEVESALVSNIEAIHEISNRWFKSELEQTAFFYKKMSKIFIYGMAVEKYKFNKFKESISVILNECIACNKDGHQCEKNTHDLFSEYILKKT